MPLGGAGVGDPGAPTIIMKMSTAPPRGAGAEGPGAPTINVKTSTTGPREVPELKVREHPPSA
jgi:hypothetical protein